LGICSETLIFISSSTIAKTTSQFQSFPGKLAMLFKGFLTRLHKCQFLDIRRTPIDLYEAWDKTEKANEWRAELEQIEGFEE
jgi:hypothetical protein